MKPPPPAPHRLRGRKRRKRIGTRALSGLCAVVWLAALRRPGRWPFRACLVQLRSSPPIVCAVQVVGLQAACRGACYFGRHSLGLAGLLVDRRGAVQASCRGDGSFEPRRRLKLLSLNYLRSALPIRCCRVGVGTVCHFRTDNDFRLSPSHFICSPRRRRVLSIIFNIWP